MFVQIMEGRVNDAAGLDRQFDRWMEDVRPGAIGFVGVTYGVTADGRGVTLVRFTSEADARANSERSEQGTWWAETAKCYDGDISFSESSDVTQMLAGGSDDAGFVQVMKSTGVDRATAEKFDEAMSDFTEIRPDVIGGYRAWTGPGQCVEVAYFTSEAEARAGEQADLPPDLAEMMGPMQESMGDTEYLDLTSPRMG